MTPADLDAIRARDDAWEESDDLGPPCFRRVPIPNSALGTVVVHEYLYEAIADRRALRILVDQLLEREREARELLQTGSATINANGQIAPKWWQRAEAWLAAPPSA